MIMKPKKNPTCYKTWICRSTNIFVRCLYSPRMIPRSTKKQKEQPVKIYNVCIFDINQLLDHSCSTRTSKIGICVKIDVEFKATRACFTTKQASRSGRVSLWDPTSRQGRNMKIHNSIIWIQGRKHAILREELYRVPESRSWNHGLNGEFVFSI